MHDDRERWDYSHAHAHLLVDRDEFGRWAGQTVQLCPVCYRRVSPTVPYRNIEPHVDTLGLERCPASGEPYYITVAAPRGTERQITNREATA